MTTTTGSELRPRADDGLHRRFARSAAAGTAGSRPITEDFRHWFESRRAAQRFQVDRIPFHELDAWSFTPEAGNLVHRSGRFFSVEGLAVSMGADGARWHQPIIVQPEVGILGILGKEFDGVLHFLMQAKMEPGNPNKLQLSPTVQATRSNYTKVHSGRSVKYLEYFTNRRRGRVLTDVLQSEHGAWFFRKSNRNVIVETEDDVPADDDFRWLTLGQIGQLLHQDNIVNMDSRTVLACAPLAPDEPAARDSDTELLSWFTTERARREMHAERIPLSKVENWERGEWSVKHELDRYFRVVAVSVRTDNREVAQWTQPLIEPVATGLAAFVFRYFHGVAHVLAHARAEGGFLDTVELGPTAQYTAESYAHLAAADRPPFLDLVLGAGSSRVRFSTILSEEGGRFLNANVRYVLVEADEASAPAEPPPGYRWVTPGQLNLLARHGHYLNVQARTLLAILNTRAVEL
ncbi:NDP-hexose 2,3-dehydratase family protein [Amycolatopsis saalfeldensis]|uniref:Oxidase EvaA n=1 Tax=Amycolatopsis saalfeldensis TaxID=394193 RepID=A0A1H8YJZ0_9PSEU|nr:NDP-hexose 2,3-dehydratase family protein [Amycolatopsis saalfeldensis]SEP52403.1 oxidase EvaA [Amycolatopsis saalfeldensis]